MLSYGALNNFNSSYIYLLSMLIMPFSCFFQAVLVFSLVKYKPAEYGSVLYPVWADGLGWCMTMASVIPIPVIAIYKLYHAEGNTFYEVRI